MRKTIAVLSLLCLSVLNADVTIKEVTSVYDGDTFKVNLNCSEEIFCKNISIRVYGVDTPEIRGSTPEVKIEAYKSKEFTKTFLKDKITIEECIRGKYFRLVCKVKNSQGLYLHEELIKNKLGKEYYGGTKI